MHMVHGWTFRLRRLAVALIATLAASLVAAGSARAEIGVNADLLWNVSPADQERELQLLGELGVRNVRLSLDWNAIEPNAKGVYNVGWLTQLDAAVVAARSAGQDILLVLDGKTPYWASSDPDKVTDATGKRWNTGYPPARPADFGDFAAFAAARFAALGVGSVQLFNEQNVAANWRPAPDAAGYARLLKAAAPRIRARAPRVTIVMGGLSQNDSAFLRGVYAAGAGSSFDVVATHTYPGKAPNECWNENGAKSRNAFCSIDDVRAAMVANGDAGKPVWITEVGYSTYASQWGYSPAQQAANVRLTLQEVAARPWIQRAYWYQLRSVYWLRDDPADWEANLGLVRSDYSKTPSFDALRSSLAVPPPAVPASSPPGAEPPALGGPSPNPPVGADEQSGAVSLPPGSASPNAPGFAVPPPASVAAPSVSPSPASPLPRAAVDGKPAGGLAATERLAPRVTTRRQAAAKQRAAAKRRAAARARARTARVEARGRRR